MRAVLASLLLLICLAACGRVIMISVSDRPAAAAAPVAPARLLPEGYTRLYSPAPHAFRYSRPGEPVRLGSVSERYELRNGDCGGTDCGNFRARTEIVQNDDATVARLNRDIWFGWSFYNATIRAVTEDQALGTVLGQWKLSGEQPAIFRLLQLPKGDNGFAACNPAVCTKLGNAEDDVVVELDEVSTTLAWGTAQNKGRICRLFSLEKNLGRWVDIVVNTNFGSDGYGYLRIWVNGELRCNYLGQMVSSERARTGVAGPTVRRGIFNTHMQRWGKAFGERPKPTMIVFYDEFRAGASRADVDPRLRASRTGSALD